VSFELDHVMVFVPDPDAIEPGWFPGCRFEPGQRHTGQGTRNRRVVFPRSFIELVWIDDGEAHERTGLRFGPRCARKAGACPFGVVLRGAVPEADRKRFAGYVVPAGGPSLLLLRAALDRPELPFVAVGQTVDGAVRTRWPSHRFDPAFLHHPSGARSIQRATIRSRVLPDLGSLRPRDVTFVSGEPALRLEIDGVTEPWPVGSSH
jgi:glyoxalase-like protein